MQTPFNMTRLAGLKVRDIVAARKCVVYPDKIALEQVPNLAETIRANGIQQGYLVVGAVDDRQDVPALDAPLHRC